MVRVKFVTEVRYGGLRVPAHTPFDAKEEDLDSLVRSGAIVLTKEPAAEIKETVPVPVAPLWDVPSVTDEPEKDLEEDDEPADSEGAKDETPPVDFRTMTVMGLKKYARDRSIDVTGIEKKADLIAVISKAL